MRRLSSNKRAETESSIILDGIYLVLGALVFIFIMYLFMLVLQYFWPPADTDLIAVNGVANKIEFALSNMPIQEGQALLIDVPIQLKKDSSIEVISPGYENNPAPAICLRQSGDREDCRTLDVENVISIAIDQNGATGVEGVNTGFILTPKSQGTANLQIKVYRNFASIHEGKGYNINLKIQ